MTKQPSRDFADLTLVLLIIATIAVAFAGGCR